MRQKLLTILCCLFIVLLADSKACTVGAEKGLVLWFSSALPALFPFALLVRFMTVCNITDHLSYYLQPLTKWMHLSNGASWCLVTGYLCGYPMGAFAVCEQLSRHRITQKEAQFLAAACNNAGPAFLYTYLLQTHLQYETMLPFFACIFYLIPFIWLFINCRLHLTSSDSIHVHYTIHNSSIQQDEILIPVCTLMIKIGIYMMLFSIIISVISNHTILSHTQVSIVALFTEITTGSSLFCQTPFSQNTKTVLTLCAAASGGACILAQTYSILKTSGLSFVHYIIDKCIISITTAITFLIILLSLKI